MPSRHRQIFFLHNEDNVKIFILQNWLILECNNQLVCRDNLGEYNDEFAVVSGTFGMYCG